MLKQSITEIVLEVLSSILSCCSKTLAYSKEDIGGNTPLHLWASLRWQLGQCSTKDAPNTNTGCPIESSISKIAEQLLLHGAKVNAANDDGETPLHMAQTWNAAKILLTKGAFPDARDLQGNTPLVSRVKKVVDCHLISTPHLPLQELYDNMKADTLKAHWEGILSYGMDPWKANEEGCTVLSRLLQADAHNLIQALLETTEESSSQKYPVYNNGDTPLHTLCRDIGDFHFWKLNLINILVTSEPSIIHDTNRKGQTPLHILCQSESCDRLTCEAIQQLRTYSAKVDIPDKEGKTCIDLAADKPELMALLTQDINILDIKPWLPWSSKSERHKNLLAEVARGQNSRQTSSFHYHVKTPIGKGAFGFVYAGLHSRDGREIAVKRLVKAQMKEPQDRREIRSLIDLSECEQVVRYLNCCEDQDFLYIELELMEGTLTELVDEKLQLQKELSLCRDVINGLLFLHQKKVIHRDIKPGNILYKCIPKLSLKLADFGLCSRISGSSCNDKTVMHSKAGTRCWMAPELLKATAEHSKASDMFACGLVVHYLFSNKKHPFGPEDETGKSGHVIKHETEDNILKNRLTVDGELNHEARGLVKQLLESNKEKRPSASEALKHPFFWSNLKRVAFLKEVGNQPEIGQPWHSKHRSGPPSSVEQDLENAFKSQLSTKCWDTEIPHVYAEMTSRRTYVTTSAVDLLRMFRNAHSHLPELSQMTRESILEKIFFDKYPTLLIDVYMAVINSGWDKRKEIAAVMDDA